MNIYLRDYEWQPHIKSTSPIKGQVVVNGKKIKLGQDTTAKQTDVVQEEGQAEQCETMLNRNSEEIKEQMLQESVAKMKERIYGEDTEERYQAVLKKAEDGEELSEKDLAYLKMKNPKLYYEIKSEEMVEKQLEERLKHCKSKEEAQNTYMITIEGAQHMCGLKGKSGVKPNKPKFRRLMKKINTVWEKYQKGELGKKKEKVKDVSCYESKNSIREKQIDAFVKFQEVDSESETYTAQG